MLAAAAVVGRAFPFGLLEQITDIDAGTLLDIVEEAEAARVIVPEERDGEVHYFFAHELIRQTLLSGLSLLRRQRLHLSVANAIERTDKKAREERPSEIAHHLMHAGAAAEVERTLAYLELTADRAMDAAAFEEAMKAIDDALSLVDDDDASRRAKLLERKGWAVRALGRFEECIDIWQSVIQMYTAEGELDGIARLSWEMGYQAIWLGDFPRAFTMYASGLAALGENQTPARAELLAGSATFTGFAGMFDASAKEFDEAERIAKEHDDKRALGRVSWGRCVVAWSQGDGPRAIEKGRIAVAQLREAGDMWTLVDALAWLSLPLAFSGQQDEAADIAREAEELGLRLGHLGGTIVARRGMFLSWFAEDPDIKRAELAARQDLAACEAINAPWVSQSHGWLAIILMYEGRFDESLEHVEHAIRLEPASAWSGLAIGIKMVNRAYVGDIETLRRLLDEHPPDPSAQTSLGQIVTILCAAQATATAGLRREAAALYPALLEIRERLSIGMFDVYATERIVAMCAAAGERWEEAERHFVEAMKIATEWPLKFDVPHIRQWHAKMLLDRGGSGDVPRARQMLTEAVAGFDTFGMPHHRAMADKLLSEAGA